jgi:glycosyltransferase involved in cell wall biosynthesis
LLGIIKALNIKKIDIPLVAIGRKTDPYFGKVNSYINENKLRNVIFPEKITNRELPLIYQNAECFIYPSLYEGFGIPVLEALVSGTPVITSSEGCFVEAGGPGSKYVDPHNYEEMGEAILGVVTSKELRNKMINIGFLLIKHIYSFNFCGKSFILSSISVSVIGFLCLNILIIE